jgi:Predicted RNA-binding protein (contains KH domain)
MDLVKLAESIVLSLVSNKEMVNVKEFETDEEDTILIQVMIDEADMGRVIGKAGKTANAIRTLVQASSYLGSNKRIRINIDSY